MATVDGVTVDIDVVEVVIKPDYLQLPIGIRQWTWIPPANILNRRLIGGEYLRSEFALGRKRRSGDVIETETVAGEFDVAGDIARLEFQFIGLDPITLERTGHESLDDHDREDNHCTDNRQANVALPNIVSTQRRGNQRRADERNQ